MPCAPASAAASGALLDVAEFFQDRHDGRVGLMPQAARGLGDGTQGFEVTAAHQGFRFGRRGGAGLSRDAVLGQPAARCQAPQLGIREGQVAGVLAVEIAIDRGHRGSGGPQCPDC